MYFGTGFRPAYAYRLRLGSDRRGRLLAADHVIDAETSSYETFTEDVLGPGQSLYSTAAVRQSYRTVPLDVNSPIWMLECYTVGAREFGRHRRSSRPWARRDGDWLIGMGMAAGVYHTAVSPARSRGRLLADGTAVVECSTSDMGPGTYTSQTQVAADALGLPVRAVDFRLGDSRYPRTPPHGGSMTMAGVGSATLDVCDQLRAQARHPGREAAAGPQRPHPPRSGHLLLTASGHPSPRCPSAWG